MTSKLLGAHLAEALPRGVAVRTYHISTTPTKTDPIFSAAPSQPEETTYRESHFLVIATPKCEDRGELAIVALEILIFSTPALTTVFVSKADSTGYGSLLKSSNGDNASITKPVIQAFINFLLEPRLTESRVVLSLFARSQDQYLFPGSVDNSEKHVLDDRQLIKWWSRVSDAVLRPHVTEDQDQQISAHLVVPGLEKGETKAFFPPSSRTDASGAPRWSNDYPVDSLTVDASLPPRCLIPRLPDDPKSRFLTDLDTDYVAEDGHWRTVKTLDQFWEFMSYRQECSAGRLVGFLWVTFIRPDDIANEQRSGPIEPSEDILPRQETLLPTPGDSQNQNGAPYPPPAIDELGDLLRPHSPPPSSPLRALLADDDANDTPHPGAEETVPLASVTVPAEQPPQPREVAVRWPTTTRGQIVTDADTYDDIVDVLLHLDFTGQAAAAESTSKWVANVCEKTETTAFGVTIEGTLETAAPRSVGVNGSSDKPSVTMLTGVRKKRKPEDSTIVPATAESQPAANVLSTGIVRKKPKVDAS